jgi:hypothetical protein
MLIIRSTKPFFDALNVRVREGDRIIFNRKEAYLSIKRGDTDLIFQASSRTKNEKFLLYDEDYYSMISFICSISGLGYWEVKNNIDEIIVELSGEPKVEG